MGHIADSLPHPGDWDGENPLYSAAEAAVFLGVKPLTITNRVYRRTLNPAAWSKDTGYCFTRATLDHALCQAEKALRAKRAYRAVIPNEEQATPPRLKRSSIDWNNPYEGRKK
ncbi:hypothetical protein [Rothia mucilaginosa]|uniref:hypothetical protein n=1 Tax=Rothia mucilaginosa TaxID=43675 RepID=UPI003C709B0F